MGNKLDEHNTDMQLHTITHTDDSPWLRFNVQEDTCYGHAGPMSRSLYIERMCFAIGR